MEKTRHRKADGEDYHRLPRERFSSNRNGRSEERKVLFGASEISK